MAVQKFKPGEVDPLDKKTIEDLNHKKQEIEKQYETKGIAPEGFDLSDGFMIGGLPARPFSAGIVSLLEMINHPMFSSDEEDAEEEMKLSDIMILLFLFLAECGEDELVSMAVDGGYNEIKKAALTWSFSIDQQQMEAMTADINKLMTQFNNTMELYSGSPGGAEEKKSVTG